MKVISATKARNNFSEIISLVAFKKEEFVVQRKGKTLARIVPEVQQGSKEQQKEIQKKLKTIEEIGKIGLKVPDDWREVEKIIADVHMPHL